MYSGVTKQYTLHYRFCSITALGLEIVNQENDLLFIISEYQ